MEDAVTKILLKMVRLVVGRAILPRGDPSQGRLPHEAAQGFILRLRRRPTSSRRAILREISMKRTPALLLGALVASLSFAFAPTYDAKLFAEMRWRGIGPLRAGRTKSAQGIAGQPSVFYIGVCNGGQLQFGLALPQLSIPGTGPRPALAQSRRGLRGSAIQPPHDSFLVDVVEQTDLVRGFLANTFEKV
jgi:hypothetical protein